MNAQKLKIYALSPAKINLCLHVTDYMFDTGYHILQSVITFAFWGDDIIFTNNADNNLSIIGEFAQYVPNDSNNLIWKSKEFLQSEFGIKIPNCDIILRKNIPVGAGLGGGTSNAATMIRIWHRLYGQNINYDDIITKSVMVGADLPVCLYNKTCLVAGIGDKITPLEISGRKIFILILKPKENLATKDVFNSVKNKHNKAINSVNINELLLYARNDLTDSAILHLAVIQDILNELAVYALSARLSGSGSACVGYFNSREECEIALKNILTKFVGLFYAQSFIYV